MMGAGYYQDRVVWMKQRESKSGNAGAIGEDFDDNGILWCRIEQPSGGERIQFASLQSMVDQRIRLRGNPGVRSVDRFRREDSQAVMVIQGIALDTDGIDQVCQCALFTEQTSETVP